MRKCKKIRQMPVGPLLGEESESAAEAAEDEAVSVDDVALADYVAPLDSGVGDFIGAFAVLVVLLVVLQRESVAPYYATALLLILNQISRSHRWDKDAAIDFFSAIVQSAALTASP